MSNAQPQENAVSFNENNISPESRYFNAIHADQSLLNTLLSGLFSIARTVNHYSSQALPTYPFTLGQNGDRDPSIALSEAISLSGESSVFIPVLKNVPHNLSIYLRITFPCISDGQHEFVNKVSKAITLLDHDTDILQHEPFNSRLFILLVIERYWDQMLTYADKHEQYDNNWQSIVESLPPVFVVTKNQKS
jgi:hypothetical protein